MKKIKLGVIGTGSIGAYHLEFIEKIADIELTSVCDIDTVKADFYAEKYNVKAFYSSSDLIKCKCCEAVIIATPHYSHTFITIDALNSGLHVLTEKPIAVHVADAKKMIEAHKKHPDLKWAAMFQQRELNVFKKLRNLIASGEFGAVRRINYTITDWFRTQSYYNSSQWRATWEGEGGGLLLNQCIHNLDMFQWLFGMPEKITGFCKFGKFHNIEVEDEVTAYFEYPENLTANIFFSTGEAPGENKLEIFTDNGKIFVEQFKITAYKANTAISEFIQTSQNGYSVPDFRKYNIDVPPQSDSNLHKKMIENFADSILGKADIIAPGEEGYNSVHLANSILYSSLTDSKVILPLDPELYENKLKKLINESEFTKDRNRINCISKFIPPYIKQ